ncbi:MAG: inorganic phosphate transporter [Armatimonadota bacterium]
MDFVLIAINVVCLLIALGFEVVNGFHDTANAVATVIYTRSMAPTLAVVWSGIVNLLGTFFGAGAGAGVAFKIVGLLPTDLLVGAHGFPGAWMILSILIVAVFWNLATWYVGLPASSSHTLIGSITGVGLMWAWLSGKEANLEKFLETLKGLALAPIVGFCGAALVFMLLRVLVRRRELFMEPPKGNAPPPWPIRALLVGTSTGVSFMHGSNDGQKGNGLIMLILIALVPGRYSVNPNLGKADIERTVAIVRGLDPVLTSPAVASNAKAADATKRLGRVVALIEGRSSLSSLEHGSQEALRTDALKAASALKKLAKLPGISKAEGKALDEAQKAVKGTVEFVAPWVTVAVALALGIGTMIGWKRIVVTVGEKIGKAHLTYGQGAAAELTAMATIFGADLLAAPVSTTHILSSGVAGAMAANGSGLQARTVRNILIAWVLTLPVTMALSAGLFWLTAGRSLVHP